MRALDLEALVSVGRPDVAADESFAVFASSRPDIAANRAVGQLWRIDLPDGSPRRLTRGVSDAAPRVSPDGARIAFLRPDAKSRSQLFVIAGAGGEPVQATDAPLGVGAFAWSPDGTALAYTARTPQHGRYGSVEGLEPAAEAPRRITGVRWQANGLGHLADRPAHVFVVAAPDPDAEPLYAPAPAVRPDGSEGPVPRVVSASARQLTTGDASHEGIVFTSDGSEVLTVRDEIEHDRRDLRTPLVAVRLDGSGERVVVGRDEGLAIQDVVVAQDGAVLLLAHETDGRAFIAPPLAVWILEEGALRRILDPDALDPSAPSTHLTAVGDDVLIQHDTRGRVHLMRVTRQGDVSAVLDGDVEVTGHAAAGERVVAAVQAGDSFGELVLVEPGAAVTLTAFGGAARATGIRVPREFETTGRDGYPIHGWIATPAGEGPHPVVLQIHGGPYTAYGIHLFDETQVLVDAGYAVVYCNPRGSSGYGRAHGGAIRHAMGTVDFTDVIDFLDAALAADGSLDAARVGIMGGSYGGYLTAWVIAHDHRFAGAIVERGFLDPASFQGTSDIGSFFGDEYVGVSAGDIERQSPMAAVTQVRTPTLVIHSDLDYRCPLEQATRYYSALKRQGTDAELLVFPGENHELTRGGQPRHRIERFEAVLDWWARHLG